VWVGVIFNKNRKRETGRGKNGEEGMEKRGERERGKNWREGMGKKGGRGKGKKGEDRREKEERGNLFVIRWFWHTGNYANPFLGKI